MQSSYHGTAKRSRKGLAVIFHVVFGTNNLLKVTATLAVSRSFFPRCTERFKQRARSRKHSSVLEFPHDGKIDIREHRFPLLLFAVRRREMIIRGISATILAATPPDEISKFDIIARRNSRFFVTRARIAARPKSALVNAICDSRRSSDMQTFDYTAGDVSSLN